MQSNPFHGAQHAFLLMALTGCAASKQRLDRDKASCTTMKAESARFEMIESERRAQLSGQRGCFSITKHEIDQTMRAHAGDVFDCLQEIVGHCSEPKRIALSMVIDEQGKVSNATVIRGTHYSPELLECVEQKVGGWSFPKPRYSDHYTFVYPYLLD